LRLRPGATAWEAIDGEVVVLDLDTSEYHVLNATASAIWRALPHGITIDDATEIVLEQFEAEPEVIRADVVEFLEQCRTAGWVDA
jgi:hypothetical protein